MRIEKANMSDAVEQEINRLNISEKDFGEAHDYLSELALFDAAIVRRALLTSAIIGYSRPFTKNAGGALSRAKKRIVFPYDSGFDESDSELHERLLALRNKSVAHSDFDTKPTGRIPGTSGSVFTWSKPFDVLGEQIDLEKFKLLTWRMKCFCVQKMLDLNAGCESEPTGREDIIPKHDVEFQLRVPLSSFKPQ